MSFRQRRPPVVPLSSSRSQQQAYGLARPKQGALVRRREEEEDEDDDEDGTVSLSSSNVSLTNTLNSTQTFTRSRTKRDKPQVMINVSRCRCATSPRLPGHARCVPTPPPHLSHTSPPVLNHPPPLTSPLAHSSICRYEVVRTAALSLGWALCEEEEDLGPSKDGGPSVIGKRRPRDWNVYWTDTSVSTQRCMRLQSYQVIQHRGAGWGWRSGGGLVGG
jgi:hypothetical protein